MKNLKIEQIAVSNYPYSKYSLDYTLDSLERTGCTNIELYACDPHFHIDDLSWNDIKVMKRKLDNHNLKVVCITPEQCIYPINIANKNLAARKRSIGVYAKCLEIAAEYGCDLCQLLAGFGCLDEKDEDIWKRSVESLQYLAEIAETYGVDIALETSPKAYTCTTDSVLISKMDKEVGSPNMKGMIDTATLGYSHETMEQAIKDLGTNLRHVHFADGIPNGHYILGEGNLDLVSMLQALDDAEYKYILSLEILNNLYTMDPERAMHTSYEWLRSHIESL